MRENELYVFHIVTRNKMNLGQTISFDKDQKIPCTISFLKGSI